MKDEGREIKREERGGRGRGKEGKRGEEGGREGGVEKGGEGERVRGIGGVGLKRGGR